MKTFECILVLVLLAFFYWWIISLAYRTKLVATIYWKNGLVTHSNQSFDGIEDFDDYVDRMYAKYPEDISKIEYTYINPTHKCIDLSKEPE